MQKSIERYRNPQVLLLEGDESHRFTLAAVLSEEGYNVTAYAGIQDAFARLEQGQVSIAVIDFNIPGISDTKLLKILGSHAEVIPIIVHTSSSSYESARNALNIGAFAYVEKGGDPEALVCAVHRAFQVRLKRYAEELEDAVTHRTQQLQEANEALRVSEAHYRSFFETAACLITSLDEHGVLINCNQHIVKLLGYQPQEAVGKHFCLLMHPDGVERAEQTLQTVVREGHAFNQEYILRRKDGSLVNVCINSSALRDRQGRFLRAICLVDDITERKRAETKILEYQAQLKSLASELTLTEERLRRRVATQLHDTISQALAITKVEVVTLREGLSDDQLCARLDYIDQMLSQALKDSRNLTSSLSYPTLEVLGFEIAVEKWLDDEIQNKHQLQTQFVSDKNPKPLEEDVRAVLFRGVRELLMNVVKHAQAQRVSVDLKRQGDNILITIEDDGIGTDIDPMTCRSQGFGLMSIFEALHRLGGELAVESQAGQGFKATLMAPLRFQQRAPYPITDSTRTPKTDFPVLR